MNPETFDLVSRHIKRLNKKLEGKPPALRIIQRRTLNTAVQVLERLESIDFSVLSTSLYFYTEDLRMNEFTKYYEQQVELAGANPERFITNLHSFYQKLSAKIKKEDLYPEFFEFYYRCSKIHLTNTNNRIEWNVILTYLDLLIQTVEYLRPSKFDFSVIIAGRTTDGEIMTIKDPYPMFDMGGYELSDILDNPRTIKGSKEVFLHNVYKKYGYDVWSLDDILFLSNNDKLYSMNIAALLPFTNEYTYDILPTNPIKSNSRHLINFSSDYPLDDLHTKLTKRRRTLPSNGVSITFEDCPPITRILLKEVNYDNRIYLLYKLEATEGDTSGFYDTKEKYFYNIVIADKENKYDASPLQSFILYLYSCYVLNDPDINLKRVPDLFGIYDLPIYANGVLHGGKLQNTYRPSTGSRIGNEDYTTETRTIQGFIRRLPDGRQASEKAIAIAESLGFDLELGYTYVQPFIKQVFKLKVKDDVENG